MVKTFSKLLVPHPEKKGWWIDPNDGHEYSEQWPTGNWKPYIDSVGKPDEAPAPRIGGQPAEEEQG